MLLQVKQLFRFNLYVHKSIRVIEIWEFKIRPYYYLRSLYRNQDLAETYILIRYFLKLSKIKKKEKGETFNRKKKYNFISKASVWLKVYYHVKNFQSHIFQHIIIYHKYSEWKIIAIFIYLPINCYFLFISSCVFHSFYCLRCCGCFIMTSNNCFCDIFLEIYIISRNKKNFKEILFTSRASALNILLQILANKTSFSRNSAMFLLKIQKKSLISKKFRCNSSNIWHNNFSCYYRNT